MKKVRFFCVILFIVFLFYTIPNVAIGASLKAVDRLNLTAYWSFNDATSTKATDVTGNGNTGTLTNFATPFTSTSGWVNAKRGSGLYFDGSNDVVTVSGDPVSTGADSICAWIYPSSYGESSFGRIMDNGGGLQFLLDNSGGSGTKTVSITSNALTYAYAATNSIQLNQWSHVCVTRNSSGTTNFYINGELSGTANQASGTPSAGSGGTTYIGNRSDGARTFDGVIDELYLFNKVLSSSEVRSVYRLGSTKFSSSLVDRLRSGLVSYWTFDGKNINWSTNRAIDSSGQNNHGTLINMSTTTSPVIGKVGQALRYDGVDDYVYFGDYQALSSGTVAFWAYADKLSADSYMVSKVKSGTNHGEWRLYADSTNSYKITHKIECTSPATATFTITSNSAMTTGRWYFVTVVWQSNVSGSQKMYIDGTLQTSTATPTCGMEVTGENLNTGRNNALATSYFSGKIDDVHIYNRALSASEISSLYRSGEGKVSASPSPKNNSSLKGYWTFDGGKINWGTGVVTDSSGLGNNGSMVNMSTSTSPSIGKIGQALSFNGSNNYVSVTDSNSLDVSAITVSAWIKPSTTLTGTDSGFVSKWNSGVSDGWFIELGYTTNDARFYTIYTSGSHSWEPTLTAFSAGTWYHVVFTFDGTTKSAYVNGSLSSSVSTSGTLQTNDKALRIGLSQGTSGASHYFPGTMDDVRVYNKALSSSEVYQLYNAGR